MRRATITLPDDLDRDLEAFRSSQSGRPSLTSLAETALRRFLADPSADPTAPRPLIQRVLAHRAGINKIAARYGASNVRLFGSVARGEAGAQSDIDFLVTFEGGRTLFDLASLRAELEDLLDATVDVVTDSGLQGETRDEIFRESLSL